MTAGQTLELPHPTTSPTGATRRFTHVVCCDPDTAMCGTDMSGTEWAPGTAVIGCVVCADLVDAPCADPNCPDQET